MPQEPEEEASLRAEELTQEKEQEPQGQRREGPSDGQAEGWNSEGVCVVFPECRNMKRP